MSKIRAEHLNEDYYARRNAPTSHQFCGHYHFVDKVGRQYMIAEANSQVFQNERLQFKPHNSERRVKGTVVDAAGYTKLYVKLPNTKTVRWFTNRAIDKEIELYSVYEDRLAAQPILKRCEKADWRSATGSIYVKGLDPHLCHHLLNK